MSKQVEFYFDYGSPTTYLAWARLLGVQERTGAEIIYRPMLLGGVFKATGNNSPVAVKPKGKWMMVDMSRFAAEYKISFKMNPHFIFNTLTIMRGAIWANRTGIIEHYNSVVFPAVWANGENMGEPESIGRVLSDGGIDAAAFAEAVQDGEIKQELIAATEAAVERGIFGAPTMFVGDEMHFGQDRIDWVERALA